VPDVLAVPLLPGIRQDIDRTLLPSGSLIRAENVRTRRGALVRRPPLVAQPTAVAQYLNADEQHPESAGSAANGPAFSGLASELVSVGGRTVFVTGARAYQSNGGAWVEGGRASRALPVEARYVSYDSSVLQPGGSDIPNGVGKVSSACTSVYTAVSYERLDATGVKQCVLLIYDRTGTVVVEFIAGDIGAAKGRQNPRVIACGALFEWFYQDDGSGASPFIYVRQVDPTLRSIAAETSLAVTKAVGDGYDAVSYKNGTEVLLVRRAGAGEAFLVERLTPGTWALLAVLTHNLAADGLSGNFVVAVYGYHDGITSQIWVVLTMADSSGARAVGYNGTLAAELSNFSLTAWLGGAFGVSEFLAFAVPSVTQRTTDDAWCALTFFRLLGSSAVYRTVVLRLNLGGSTPTSPATILHALLASRLYEGTSTAVKCWLHTDNGTLSSEVTAASNFAWKTQRRYCLATIVLALDSFGTLQAAVVQPELIPDERSSFYMRGWLPEVAIRLETDDNGHEPTVGYVPLLSPVKTSAGSVSKDSLAVILYRWEDFGSQTSVARRVIEHASGTLILGGGLQELHRNLSNRNVPRFNATTPTPEITNPRGFENGFLHAPAVFSVTASDDPTANLTPSGLYQFCAMYEHIDDLGRQHRSALSNVVQGTAPDATTQFAIQIAKTTFTEREMASMAHRVVVHVFATAGNGQTFYRVTPNAGAPCAWDSNNTFQVTFNFTGGTDTKIQQGELTYTFGGVKPNRPAPAHRFGARGAGRVMLGGLFDPRLVEASKIERQNQPTEFTREDAFRTMLPERCTGLAFLDGNFVAFTRRAIYLISGASLPDDKGSPSVSSPVPLPSTVGCIDWRSVVETPDGVVFQSERGIHLLPRGFGQPVLISAQIQDELRGRRVISACVVGDPGSEYGTDPAEPIALVDRAIGQHLLVLSVCAPDSLNDEEGGRLLVYDLDRRAWVSADDPGATPNLGALVANLGGRLAVASRVQTVPDIRLETPGDWASAVANLPMRLSLADLRPFGVLTQGSMLRIQVLGEIRSSRAKLEPTVTFDGKYSAARTLTPLQVIGEPGDKFTLEWSLPARKLTALGLELVVTDGGNAGETLALHAIGVEVLPPRGRAGIGADRRAA
jgi:hypothetical protein